MFRNKMKLVTAVLVAVALAGGGIGAWASRPVGLAQDAQNERAPRAQKTNELQLVRSARQRTVANLRQIALAMAVFEGEHKHWPLAAIYNKDGKPLLSWRVAILPQLLDGRTLYDQFHLDEPWDSPHNKPLLSKMPPAYALPGIGDSMTTYYQVFTGDDTLFETRIAKAAGGASSGLSSRAPRAVTITDVLDRTSNTLLVVEA